MKVLQPHEMRAADQAAIAAGIPELVLMENAAFGLLHALEQRFAPLSAHRIAIFCGKGNNGGDGLALARLLHQHHHPARLDILLAYPPEDLSPASASQLKMLAALGIPYTMQWPADLDATTLAIDALLGTGVSGIPRSPIAEAITRFNSLPLAKRVAVDIPSASLIRAHLTVTFAAPKPELVLPPHCDLTGELVVVPIGIPPAALATARWNLTTPADLAPILTPRPLAAHKGHFGHVLLIGGAPGKPGALQLAGHAAISAGAGWVSLASPDPAFQPALPDLMLATPWPPDLSPYHVLAIGPGLGLNHAALVHDLYHHAPQPLVLDADALNLLAPLSTPPSTNALRVLTPHPGEMRRLLGADFTDRPAAALQLSTLTQSVIVLKGQRTLIAFPSGDLWINPTGSPALAKAGSGDVLTGLIAAFLAQHPDHPQTAILAAVFLHGRLGELAARHGHERTSLASQLIHHLPEALRELA